MAVCYYNPVHVEGQLYHVPMSSREERKGGKNYVPSEERHDYRKHCRKHWSYCVCVLHVVKVAVEGKVGKYQMTEPWALFSDKNNLPSLDSEIFFIVYHFSFVTA